MAAGRLHESLKSNGHESQVFVHHGATAHSDVQTFATTVSKLSSMASRSKFKALSRDRYYFREQDWTLPDCRPLGEAASGFAPTIIIAHFLTGFIDLATLAELHARTGAPVIFYLMDMAPFTGGCHFAWECRGYQNFCGHCPALLIAGQFDQSARVLARKQAALAEIRHSVVAGSSTLSAQAARSSLFGRSEIHTVPLAIEYEVFRPRDNRALAPQFGLDPDKPILFFGSRAKEQERKGIPVLQQALRIVAARRPKGSLPQLLVAGDGPDFTEFRKAGYTVRALGQVSLEALAECYACADAFISPSVEDSGPMMINEAVMSGCPVVAFDIGVARDLLEPKVSGFLSERVGDATALAHAIECALDLTAEKREEARQSLRSKALQLMTPEAQALSFERVARELRATIVEEE